MKRGVPLKRTSALKRTRLRKGTKGFRRYAGQADFKAAVFALHGDLCLLCFTRHADDAHHLIPKRTLSFYGLAEHAADPRNGFPLCRNGHEGVERRSIVLAYENLPQCAIDFATELGLEWKLERQFPRRAA